ncbi:MAG TPA: HI0074 family nucleotidyltransferase substrate-binding subunit [Methylomusa anaerophila]|uniref:Nucleotidyltransferase substrate binding protein like protein n=1 Tax=Methylomusa anaerophila TaxID=1930071 RepID=A0A348AKS3_9FIRM|nr:HI0074 family nucleotidyltransferase substrate-binding subunit [Methylomusa anaerophila]BBB91671.1 nucleotidyltransferase substrate binding protein like protein [Methylomusa anaerophila]HML88595.1 HI0074 family nucleotidyltransferase substrate-binding subunit [Methylomusa anaerophila]
MARLHERLDAAKKALARLQEAMALVHPTLLERDAGIQRFEFSFEAVWKAAQAFLTGHEGLDAASPKGVIRYCREVGLLNDDETIMALHMADDRNLTAYTYNEPLAAEIYARVKEYGPLLEKWLDRMRKRLED